MTAPRWIMVGFFVLGLVEISFSGSSESIRFIGLGAIIYGCALGIVLAIEAAE